MQNSSAVVRWFCRICQSIFCRNYTLLLCQKEFDFSGPPTHISLRPHRTTHRQCSSSPGSVVRSTHLSAWNRRPGRPRNRWLDLVRQVTVPLLLCGGRRFIERRYGRHRLNRTDDDNDDDDDDDDDDERNVGIIMKLLMNFTISLNYFESFQAGSKTEVNVCWNNII